LIYASINRGIKGGNWSPSSAVTLDDFRHDEEDLMAYELGYKTTVLNGSVRLNPPFSIMIIPTTKRSRCLEVRLK